MRWHGCADIVRDLRLVLPGRRYRLDSTVELHTLLGQRHEGTGVLFGLEGRRGRQEPLTVFSAQATPGM